MSYATGRPQRKTRMPHTRQRNPELETRIERLLAGDGGALTDWERNFLSSVAQSAKQYGSLTGKQESILQRIETNNNPEVQAARKNWREAFSDEMREKMKVAGRYYLANPPYFNDLANRILNDDVFIPTEKQYRSMVENKYVQKVLDNMKSVPTFPVGSMAQVRTVVTGHVMRHYRDKMVMIIDYPDKVAGAAKGAIHVIVLPIGSAETIETEVRWLKKARV
jgi:hypothetical protein